MYRKKLDNPDKPPKWFIIWFIFCGIIAGTALIAAIWIAYHFLAKYW